MRLSRLFGKTDVTSDVVINIQPEIQFFEKNVYLSCTSMGATGIVFLNNAYLLVINNRYRV